MSTGSPAIAVLRARLALQVAAPLVVSTRAQQYTFGDDFAAYAEIDVRRDEDFVVVAVIGSLPEDEFIANVWHRLVREVWLIDARDEAVYVARAGERPRRFDRDEVVRSAELPGVAIAVDALFAPPS